MILLDNVTKYYPGDTEPVLDNVTLHIQPKEFVFLVGESGAGKSTLIKMLTREEKPTSGKIMVGGIDYDYLRKRHIPHLRRRIGVVFQDLKLLPNRTVFENVAFALEIVGVSNAEIRRTVPKVLDLVGLADKGDKFPDDLSGGQRQRVAIARSMARQPKILIADEPTGNLDPKISAGIMRLLEEINNFGTTILVTTHDVNIVNQMRRRVGNGHYYLDAERANIAKRPLATSDHTSTVEEIRAATNSPRSNAHAAAQRQAEAKAAAQKPAKPTTPRKRIIQ